MAQDWTEFSAVWAYNPYQGANRLRTSYRYREGLASESIVGFFGNPKQTSILFPALNASEPPNALRVSENRRRSAWAPRWQAANHRNCPVFLRDETRDARAGDRARRERNNATRA